MTVFDLLFILAVLASLVAMAVAAVLALRRRFAHALKIVWIYGICAAGYLAIGAAVSFFEPPQVMNVGDPWCFDDWCLAAEKVDRTPGPSQVTYKVSLRIFSSARGATQRANGAWIYLIDDRGRRYSPDQDPAAVPLNVLLQPQQSVDTARIFHVPLDAQGLGLITGHGGPYCGPMDMLIIGRGGCLFHKPAMIRIP